MTETHNPLISNGGAERDRTVGLLNAIQALSQLSYSPTKIKNNTAQNVLSNQICLLFIPISLVGRRWTRGPSFLELTYGILFLIVVFMPEW
jgi:hypothetical protein